MPLRGHGERELGLGRPYLEGRLRQASEEARQLGTDSLAIAVRVRSNSSIVFTPTGRTVMPSRGATGVRSARNGAAPGLVWFTNTATRSVFGLASFSSSISLILTSFTRNDRPVTLPSGRAKLVTRPYRTGSPVPL